MLRKLLYVSVAAAALLLTAEARAITTNLQLTGTGQSLKTTTVTLIVTPPRTSTAKTKTIKISTTKTGKITNIPNFNRTDYPPGETTIELIWVDDGGIKRDETYTLQQLINLGLIVPQGPDDTSTIDTIDGLTLGLYLMKQTAYLHYKEYFEATGQLSSEGSTNHDPLGAGFMAGYPFRPWKNNLQVMPFVSLEFPNNTVNFVFPGGSFLGTRSNYIGTLGLKAGPIVSSTAWLYGIAGVSVLNETMTLNFPAGQSSSNATVPGFTLGLGGSIKPAFLQGFGRPVSLFAEYQYTWWQRANFNAPSAAPAFNYSFLRNDSTIKAGFTVSLGR